MARRTKLTSVLKDLGNKRKIRTLVSHPKEVFRENLLALEDMIGPKISAADRMAFMMSKERLWKFMSRERSLRDILHTAFNYSGYWTYRSICPQQIPLEIEQLAREVERLAPSTVLEIGTANGGTLYLWARYLKSCHRIISIDLPEGYPHTNIKFYRLFDPNKEFFFLRCDSHSRKTLDMLDQILIGGRVDFLYIDGDHSYLGAKQDFKTYGQFVRPGGIIAFHDIMYHHGYGVDKLWKEAKSQHVSKEIVASRNQIGFGIGVLHT